MTPVLDILILAAVIALIVKVTWFMEKPCEQNQELIDEISGKITRMKDQIENIIN